MQENMIYIAYFGIIAAAVFFKYKEWILSRFWPQYWCREYFLPYSGDMEKSWQRTGKKYIRGNETYYRIPSRAFHEYGVAAWMHEEGNSMPKNLRSAYEPANDPRTINAMENIDYNQWHEKRSPLEGFNKWMLIGFIIVVVIGYYAYKYYQGMPE